MAISQNPQFVGYAFIRTRYGNIPHDMFRRCRQNSENQVEQDVPLNMK